MPFEPKSPTMVKKMKKGEMFEHISELYNVIDLIHNDEVKWRKDALHFRTAHNMFIDIVQGISLDGATGRTLEQLKQLKTAEKVEDR